MQTVPIPSNSVKACICLYPGVLCATCEAVALQSLNCGQCDCPAEHCDCNRAEREALGQLTGGTAAPWLTRTVTAAPLGFYRAYAYQARLRVLLCPACGCDHVIDTVDGPQGIECHCLVVLEADSGLNA